MPIETQLRATLFVLERASKFKQKTALQIPVLWIRDG
jgi:hypothetical protein